MVTSRPRPRSPTHSSVTRVVFSVDPSTSANGCLTGVDVDPEGDHTARLREVHSVDHQRDQVQPGQVRTQQVGQGRLGHLHEPARDRGPRGGRRGLRNPIPDRFQADPVAAGRQARQHPFHRHPPEDLGGGEQLVGRHRQLTGAVHSPDPRPLHAHPAPAQGHRAGPGAMAHRYPLGVVAPARTCQRGHVGFHQRTHHLQAGADRQREQPLAHVAGDIGHHHAHPLRHGQFERVSHAGRLGLILLGHGGPLSTRVVFGGRPTPTPRQASGGGPPPQVPRTPGQPKSRTPAVLRSALYAHTLPRKLRQAPPGRHGRHCRR